MSPRPENWKAQIAGLRQQLEVRRPLSPTRKRRPSSSTSCRTVPASPAWKFAALPPEPVLTREFYTEVPFEVDLDGTYYQVA